MDNNSRTYTTTVKLNAEEARNELARLQAKVEELRQKKEQAFSVGNATDGEKYAKQLKQAERDLNTFRLQTMDVQEVLNGLGSATTQQINKAMRSLKSQMANLPTDSEEFKTLADRLQQCKDRLAEIGREAKEGRQSTKELTENLDNLVSVMGNLKGASMNELKQAEQYLQGQVSSLKPSDTRYDIALAQLQEVRQRIAEVNEEQKESVTIVDQYNRELAAAGQQMLQVEDGAELVSRTMANLDAASLRDIEYTMKLLNEQMRGVATGSDEFQRLNGQMGLCKQRMADIAQQQKRGKSIIDQYNEELRRSEGELKITQQELNLVDRTLNSISTANIRDLEYSIKILNEQLRNTTREKGNVEKITKQLKDLNTELQNVKESMKPEGGKGNIFSRGWEWLNKNWGAMSQALDAYSGIRDVIKGSVEAFAEMDQEMNNVRKYTGQTIDEVKAMNEAFKQMDTRTPREQLNQLAGSAGRLGLQGKEDIMDFVYAADQINLALGDDLGQGAVDAIGKLAMAFGEDDEMGLRDAMLSTGSAVNELAQNSAANAGYLVDFAARLSGVGVQAGLTQAQILGLGAAMDENMQRDEMAATALSQIITKMTTDSETFARIAGKNIEEFAQLVKTDMNAALMQFFEAMNRKGGFTELAPLFEQMGLDGTRAIGVLTTLSSKIDDVRKHQQLATEAYEEHTSVEKEAEIQNATYQAKLEKCRKAFGELRIELGERLLPAATFAISTTGLLVKALGVVSGFIIDNHKLIITLTAAITGYAVAVAWANTQSKLWHAWEVAKNVAMKAGAAITATYKGVVLLLAAAYNAVTGNVTRATAAMKLFNMVTKASPVGLLVGAISAAAAAFALFTGKADKAEEAQRRMTETQKKAADAFISEETRVKNLSKAVHDNTLSLQKRKEALDELKRIIPEYNAELSREGKLTRDNTQAIDNYLKKRKEQLLLEAYEDQMKDAYKRQADAMRALSKMIEKYKAGDWGSVQSMMFAKIREEANAANKEVAELEKAYNETLHNIDRMSGRSQGGNATTDSQGGNADSTMDTQAYWQQQLDTWNKKLADLRNNASATATEIEEAAKHVKEAQDKVELFTNRKQLDKQEKKEEDEKKKRLKAANDAAKAETEQRMAALTHQYAMGEVTYRDYVKQQEQIQREGIERRMLIYGEETLEYQKLARQRQELLLNGDEQGNRLRMADIEAAHRWLTMELEEQAETERWTEEQKNEALFREDMRYMEEKLSITRKNSEEHMQLQQEMDETEQREQLRRQQYYRQQLQQAREQLLQMDNERTMQMELDNINEVYDHMIAQCIAKETERHEAILAVRAKYANYQTTSERDQQKASQMLSVARSDAKQKRDAAVPGASPSGSTNLPFVSTIVQYQATMERLKELYANDEQNHAAYLAAKQQATAQFCQELAAEMQAAYNTVNQVMQAASSYFSAQQEYETTIVQKKYEKQIDAAGNNQKKVKKLQEQQQKEEAAIKTKYAKRAATIQMAQAVAQTAISAINAYSSAAAIPVTGFVLAPIAAAAAIAAGLLQIATIKKQQQAQQAGYYEGGFTRGRRYRKEAGVVHEGEFVANHQAVENPAILPFLNFIDQAQRNNTVGSLTMQDVSRALSVGGGSAVAPITPIVNVQTDNEELRDAVQAHREATELLLMRLEQPINAQVVLTGPDGLNEQQRRLNNMMKNK